MSTAPAHHPRRALVVRGGWDGHQPVTITDQFLPFLEKEGYDVLKTDTLDVYEDTELLAATDLIVQCWTMGEITPAQSQGLAAAVRAGTGLAGWHGGIVDSFRGDVSYQLLTGGQFLMHPPGFHEHAIRVLETGHPVMAGLGDFTVHTEQYWMATDPLNEVLATTEFEVAAGEPWRKPVVMPAVWTRHWGEGRVFVSTIGHKPDDFDVPEVRTLTERGLLWASR